MKNTVKDLVSREYHLLWGSGQGAGTFFILRKIDNRTSLRFVCYEGYLEYKRLKSAYTQSRKRFNQLCAALQYS